MTNRMIATPSVHVVAATAMVAEGVAAFASEQGLGEVATTLNTPLSRILTSAEYGSDTETDLELLTEFAGRQCYNAWRKGRGPDEYIDNIMSMAHGSVLEHANISVVITGVSRSLTHELIRHRAGFAVSQESQRYVDAEDMNFVVPPILLEMWGGDLECSDAEDWMAARLAEVDDYLRWQADIEVYIESLPTPQSFIDDVRKTDADSILTDDEALQAATRKFQTVTRKRANEAARASLPNASETKLVWTGNLRALRHVLMLRGDGPADLEIRRIAVALLEAVRSYAPLVFHDLAVIEGDFGVPVITGTYNKV